MPAAFLNSWVLVEAGSVLLLGAGAAAALGLTKLASTRRRLHSPKFASVSERSFTEYLARFGFDPVVASTTYRYLREVQDVRFPILPGDTLDWDLGLDDEKVGQTIHELSSQLDRQPLRTGQLPVTVEDLVRTVQFAPHSGAVAAA